MGENKIMDKIQLFALPPFWTASHICVHIEKTIHAVLVESTPPLSGKKNPPCPDLRK